MFGIAIRYLNGWAMAAADGARKEQAEWPPHPDRVFMAMAAAWFETGENAAEKAALCWIENQEPPSIAASDASQRGLVTSYVPVNDARSRGAKIPSGSTLQKLKESGLHLLPEFRSRQPRSFPVVIPNDSVVYFMWMNSLPMQHKDAMENLLSKVTHIGHSASLVQVWIAERLPDSRWVPTKGIAKHRLRVPYSGRLADLKQNLNRDNLLKYTDIAGEISRIKGILKEIKEAQPHRAEWNDFPDLLILKDEPLVKQNLLYAAAKAGDAIAAGTMVEAMLTPADRSRIQQFIRENTEDENLRLAAVHAYEKNLNAIPAALMRVIGEYFEIASAENLRQSNIVSHTGAGGFGRLARQALFVGEVEKGANYILIDDFVGQGGTIANLRGYILKNGGHVAAAIVLTGKPYSAKITPSAEQLKELNEKHGQTLERWWREYFGHTFDRLTQSEARYLTRSPNVDRIRERIIEEKCARDFRSHHRDPKAQKRHQKRLELQLKENFPNGVPFSRRPITGQWQGYGNCRPLSSDESTSNYFNCELIVLRLFGARIGLSSTLRLTGALRGALLKYCRIQPPPEWLSGHTQGGAPTIQPHLALIPMPFVGSQHADGSIIGIALALPQRLDETEAANCLGEFLYDNNCLSIPRRLFDREWLECQVEHETREIPPLALRSERWTRRSRIWATVTPIVLDRHYNGSERWTCAAADVKLACERSGLPRPKEVVLHPTSLVQGVFHAQEYPRMKRKSDGGTRSHTHAVLIFGQAVTGPIIVGAGRFRGYGLCLPIDRDG